MSRHRLPGWIAALWLGAMAATAATSPPPPQEPADFNHPPRDYVERTAAGWKILVERELADHAPSLCDRALSRLETNLFKMRARLPAAALTNLARIPVFLMYGSKSSRGGRSNGAEYHQRHAPQHFSWLDPRMGGSVVIYSAENYVWIPDLWALKVLVHEFAHARQLEQWPEEQPDILRAYEKAMAHGKYRQARDLDSRLIEKTYAAVNQLEYFAELSCMYFCGCNYPPLNREQLRAYDPDGEAMIRKMWGLPADAAPARAPTP